MMVMITRWRNALSRSVRSFFVSLRWRLILMVLFALLPTFSLLLMLGRPSSPLVGGGGHLNYVEMALLGLIGLAAIALTAVVGESFILRQVHQLAQAAAYLGKGDLSTRAGKLNGGELNQLALAFDSMAERLQQREIARTDAERALQASEARYRLLAEASQDIIFLIGRDDRVQYVNQRAAEQFGLEPADLIGQPRCSLFPPHEARQQQASLQKVFASGEPLHNETLVTLGNRCTWQANWLVPVKDAAGSVEAVLGVSRDITARKQMEDALRESEAHYRLLFEANPHPMWVYDLETLAFLAVNDAAVRHYGYTREEFLALTIADIRPPEDVPAMRDYLTRAPTGTEMDLAGVWRHRKQDGTLIEVEITAHALEFAGRPAKLVLAQDVTARRQAEEATRLQMQRLDGLRQIDMAISGSLDLKITLEILLDQVVTQLRVHASAVLLFNPALSLLSYTTLRGFRSAELPQTQRRLGQGYAGQAALERRLVYVPDLRLNGAANGMEAGYAPDHAFHQAMQREEFVTYYGVPLIAKGLVMGVLEVFHRAPLAPNDEWREFLQTLAGQAAIAIENASLFERLQNTNQGLMLAYDATIEGWSRALDMRGGSTPGHAQRAAELTLQLARAAGLPNGELAHLRRGALLHDIGKMGIPDHILHKPEPLTDDERAVLRRHPLYAHELLSPVVYLRPALDIPYCYHEWWDGTGYPRGLKGEAIPLAARLFAVTNTWDALRSDRPGRPAWPVQKAREYIRSCSGTRFDPYVVDLFLKIVES